MPLINLSALLCTLSCSPHPFYELLLKMELLYSRQKMSPHMPSIVYPYPHTCTVLYKLWKRGMMYNCNVASNMAVISHACVVVTECLFYLTAFWSGDSTLPLLLYHILLGSPHSLNFSLSYTQQSKVDRV